jgi:hypothetical protein
MATSKLRAAEKRPRGTTEVDTNTKQTPFAESVSISSVGLGCRPQAGAAPPARARVPVVARQLQPQFVGLTCFQPTNTNISNITHLFTPINFDYAAMKVFAGRCDNTV